MNDPRNSETLIVIREKDLFAAAEESSMHPMMVVRDVKDRAFPPDQQYLIRSDATLHGPWKPPTFDEPGECVCGTALPPQKEWGHGSWPTTTCTGCGGQYVDEEDHINFFTKERVEEMES